jgi:hypothetical protein
MKRKLYAATQVGYIPVRIYRTEGLVEKNGVAGTTLIKNNKAVVEIDSQLTGNEYYEILIHELIHATDFIWNLGLSENKIMVLGMMLCQALRGMKKIR